MAEGSDEEHKHTVSPAVTDRFTGFSAVHGPPAKITSGLNGVDWIFGFYSTSAFEQYQFLWGNRKKYRENSDCFFSTETSIERPHEFAYARMSHDRVQPPLALSKHLPCLRVGKGYCNFAKLHLILLAEVFMYHLLQVCVAVWWVIQYRNSGN